MRVRAEPAALCYCRGVDDRPRFCSVTWPHVGLWEPRPPAGTRRVGRGPGEPCGGPSRPPRLPRGVPIPEVAPAGAPWGPAHCAPRPQGLSQPCLRPTGLRSMGDRRLEGPSRFWLSLEKENRIEIGDPPPTRSPHPEPRSCGALSPRPTCPAVGRLRPREPSCCPSPAPPRPVPFAPGGKDVSVSIHHSDFLAVGSPVRVSPISGFL